MKYTVFIQANDKQLLGAMAASFAISYFSTNTDKFDIKILNAADYDFLQAKEGKLYLRAGVKKIWRNNDLQSFTPLRFMPPELMQYQGRALVIDPDVFACTDIWPFLNTNMYERAIACRAHNGLFLKKRYASSVMLLNCAKLGHWHTKERFNALFNGQADYAKWINLQYEPQESIQLIDKAWNSFDKLTTGTNMLHNTRRQTQPWKTGLPQDFTKGAVFPLAAPAKYYLKVRNSIGINEKYAPHPDKKQECFFFCLVKTMLKNNDITTDFINQEIQKKHLRPDALELINTSNELQKKSVHPATYL